MADVASVARLARARCVGAAPCADPDDADAMVPVTDALTLALKGRTLPADDRRVLAAFAGQAAAVVERRRLAHQAMQAKARAEGNRIRTALLAAVSHDLRTPLASPAGAGAGQRGGERRAAHPAGRAGRTGVGQCPLGASAHSGRVELRVADRGPGVPAAPARDADVKEEAGG